MSKLKNVLTAEGYTGELEEMVYNPWPDLYAARQNSTVLQCEATGIEVFRNNKGEEEEHLVIMTGGAKILIPFSEADAKTSWHLMTLVGQSVAFKVIAIDRDSNLAIGSRKQALETMAKLTWSTIKEGDTIPAVVRFATQFNAIVDIGGVTVAIPRSECSWGWVHDVRKILNTGDNINVRVTRLDKEGDDPDQWKVEVSLKETLPNPWPTVPERYKVGDKIAGVVTGLPEFGIFVNLEPGVDALIPQLRNGRPSIGDKLLIKLTRIDMGKHQIGGHVVRILSRRR